MTTSITLSGRLTKDPEIRFASSGMAVTDLSVVTSGRKKVGDKWEDVDVTYWSVTAFKKLAENVAESLSKGDDVVIVGKVKSRSYETKDGTKRTVWEVTADHVGANMVRHCVTVKRVERVPSAPSPFDDPDPWSTPVDDINAPF